MTQLPQHPQVRQSLEVVRNSFDRVSKELKALRGGLNRALHPECTQGGAGAVNPAAEPLDPAATAVLAAAGEEKGREEEPAAASLSKGNQAGCAAPEAAASDSAINCAKAAAAAPAAAGGVAAPPSALAPPHTGPISKEEKSSPPPPVLSPLPGDVHSPVPRANVRFGTAFLEPPGGGSGIGDSATVVVSADGKVEHTRADSAGSGIDGSASAEDTGGADRALSAEGRVSVSDSEEEVERWVEGWRSAPRSAPRQKAEANADNEAEAAQGPGGARLGVRDNG